MQYLESSHVFDYQQTSYMRSSAYTHHLLDFLTPLSQRQHLQSFTHRTLAVDIASVLQRLSRHDRSDRQSQMSRKLTSAGMLVDVLKHYSIKAIFVFNGRSLKPPSVTNSAGKEKGGLYSKKSLYSQDSRWPAYSTHEGDYELMKLLYNKKAPFVVAPYEASSQIAWFYSHQGIEGAISEDETLLALGVPMLTDLTFKGDCTYYQITEEQVKKCDDRQVLAFMMRSEEEKINCIILSGTKYNPPFQSLPRAIKAMSETVSIEKVIQRLFPYDMKPQLQAMQQISHTRMVLYLSTVYNTAKSRLEMLCEDRNSVIPNGMSFADVVEVVGKHYDFGEEVMMGFRHAVTLQEVRYDEGRMFEVGILDLESMRQSERAFIEYLCLRGQFLREKTQVKLQRQAEQNKRQSNQRLELQKSEGVNHKKTTLELILEDYLNRDIDPLDKVIAEGLANLKPNDLKPFMPNFL